jgi:mannose-6-phosphate isomerase
MEEEKKLYPFRLISIEDEFQWGKEIWRLADLGWRDTPVRDGWLAGNSMGEIMETYLDRIVGDDVFDSFGQQFPFQIKNLSVNGKMPLMVSADDEIARQRYDSLGKEKLWYVCKAESGTRLLLGLRKYVETADFIDACISGEVDALMNSASIKAGDYFHIPTGIPHCIMGKAEILEISESSALDFRLCSWGEPMPENDTGLSLSLVDALDFIDRDKFPAEKLMGFSLEDRREKGPANVLRLLSLPQFSSKLIALDDALHISASGSNESCVAYSCIKGEFTLQLPKVDDEKIDYLPVKTGETVLVPAEVDEFYLLPRSSGTTLIETLVEPRPEHDSYLDSDDESHSHDHSCHDCDSGDHSCHDC